MSESVKFINEQMIRRAIATLIPPGAVFEARILNKSRKKIISGYFTDAETLIQALGTVDLRGVNVYTTLQGVSMDCYSRSQHDKFEVTNTTTSDTDIDEYHWLFIDLDPIRKSEISSTQEELNEAAVVGKKIYDYMKGIGFEEPLIACSGNGVHLLYKISMEKNDENKAIVEQCLKVLAVMFNSDKVKIDTVNSNPSRICKLYGTLAQKGANTANRPHRMSVIISKDEDIRPTKKVYLEKLAGAIQIEKPEPAKYNNYNPSDFDVAGWLDQHHMGYSEKAYKDAKKFILDECPFNPDHKAPDSFILQHPDGKIAFSCSHNSCAGHNWRELWTKIDPNTYNDITEAEDKRIEEGWKQHNAARTDITYSEAVIGVSDEPIWLNAEMIASKPDEGREFIRTGCNLLDAKMAGLEKGALSLVSGLRGGGKSTLLNGWMLNAIEDGHTVVTYSGELSDRNMMRWMFLQAAGKAHTVQSRNYEGMYYTTKETQLAISRWMGDKFWLYNNVYGNNYQKVYELIKRQVEEKKADFIVIDNIMALDLDTNNRDKWDAQTQFIWQLKDLAKISFSHVLFVAHPRKAAGFLRLDDVSGSGNIGNIVDNAFIVHRNNDDFKNRTKAEFKRPDTWEGYQGTNVIEICKNRDNGVQDMFIPLYYEQETKRLKNYASENVIYSWDKSAIPDGFILSDEDVPW